MIFSKRKRNINRNFQYQRKKTPSWKSYRSRSRRSGSSRKRVFTLQTPRLVISELRLFVLKIVYYALFLLLFSGVVYFFFFSEWMKIGSVLVEGNKTTDKKLVLDVTEPYLHKKSFFVFPSDNFFFVPTRQIEKEILSSFKRVSKVEVRRSFPRTIVVNIEEKKAVLLFCGNPGCVWADEEGVAYNKSSYSEALADASEVVIVQDSSNSDLPIGQLTTDPANVDFANRLWHVFPDKIGKELEYLSAPLPGALEIRAHTKEGWAVYLDMTLDLEKNLELLNQVLEQEFKDKPEGTVCLDYVDLRVVDRVFYKIKDNCPGGGPPPADETQSENVENQEGEQANPASQTEETRPATAEVKKDKKKKKKN